MSTTLPKEAFIALAALSWADGDLRASEKSGLISAARAAGVPEADLPAIERALSEKTPLESFAPGDMSDWQRIVTYAIGCWLARLDGVVSTDERDSLQQLAKRLDLTKPVCERAGIAAFDVYVQPEGGRPDRFDFVRLEQRLRERLPQQAANAG